MLPVSEPTLAQAAPPIIDYSPASARRGRWWLHPLIILLLIDFALGMTYTTAALSVFFSWCPPAWSSSQRVEDRIELLRVAFIGLSDVTAVAATLWLGHRLFSAIRPARSAD
jgi:hypothetical protein